MSFDKAFETALERVADGLSVRWAELARLAETPQQRHLVQQLQILGGVGATHASSDADAPTSNPNAETIPEPSDRVSATGRWGRFEMVRSLGKGSYGVVYLGRDSELQRDVAIKLFHGRVTDRVKLEGRLLARIKHDHVVKIYDVAEHDKRFGLCMEYIEGRTLADLVRVDGPLSAEQAALDGQAVCKALAAVHANNVLHRDVSARNVMRERGGRIVLMDLGAGMVTERTTGDQPPNVGTPLFMAPELFGEMATATSQSDLYSLGVLLYYLVTGRYPVEGASIDDIRQNHRAGRRVPIDERRLGLPPLYVRLVERATATDPAERYPSAVALLRDLNRIVTPDPPQPAPAPAPVPPSWQYPARAAGVLSIGAVVLAGLSGVLTSFTFNSVIDRPPAFDPDGLTDTLTLGARAMVQPVAVMSAGLGIGAVVTMIGRLLPWRGLLLRGWTRLVPADLGQEEYATVVAQLAVLIGLVAVAVVYFAFADVLVLFRRSITTDALDGFAVFGPGIDARGQKVAYRMSLAALLLIVVLAWKTVRSVRLTHGGVVPAWVRGAGVVLAGLLFVFCQAPYKLMNHNDLPVVLVEGQRCSLLGERESEARVFCPASAPPRVRTIRLANVPLTRCGFEESVFIGSTLRECTPQPALK